MSTLTAATERLTRHQKNAQSSNFRGKQQIRVVLLGPPETRAQAGRLANQLGINSLSVGDVVRSHGRAGTSLGLTAKPYIDAGLLVPDTLVSKLVRGRLGQANFRKGFLLEGYPRTAAQAMSLNQFLADQGTKLDLVLLLGSDYGQPRSTLPLEEAQRSRSDAIWRQTIPQIVECLFPDVVAPVRSAGNTDETADRLLDACRLRLGTK